MNLASSGAHQVNSLTQTLCIGIGFFLLESHVKSHDQTKCAWSEMLAIQITKEMLWYILFIINTLLCLTCIFPGNRNET